MPEFISTAADLRAPRAFPWISDGLAYGADYSPEQWSEQVWLEDVELMRRSGVTTVSLGIFSWGLLEVADGKYEWSWLDRVLELLHGAGVGVNLATPTAAPPMWLLHAHPEIATVDEFGVRTAPGGRLAWSPSSAVFRRYALRIVREMAKRYGRHPAVRLWHVSNELGNENARCYSEETATAWRRWLAEKYGRVDALNDAWGTAFWGHHYPAFEFVDPPRHARTSANPGMLLDFARFTSDALLAHYIAERDVLREVTPDIPVTTNFMVMGEVGTAEYARWAREVDLVSNDHYTMSVDPDRDTELSFSADRVRGMAGGAPWLLMEHSTSAVNWQPVNRAKEPGELARNSLAHVAHGADGVMYFQWRASTAGSETFHSAMVPHAGADSRVFEEIVELGARLRALKEVRGTRVEAARVAIMVDEQAAFALRSAKTPSVLLRHIDLARDLHRALTLTGYAVDVVGPRARLDPYALVLVPTLYLADDATAVAVAAVVERGGHVLIGPFSGIVDSTGRVRSGGYPGAFRDLLGIRVDEFVPLLDGQRVALDDGGTASIWSERVRLDGADVVTRFADGPVAGWPAVTRRTVGLGTATYLATRLDDSGLARLVAGLVAAAGVNPVADTDAGLEAVRRIGDARFLFLINHDDRVRVARVAGVDAESGVDYAGRVEVAPGAVVVVRERA